MKGLISNIQRFSTHDGPGIRTTVFFQGCPLRCPWCQNPETLTPHRQIIFDVSKCVMCNQCVNVCKESCFKEGGDILEYSSKECTQCGNCVDTCKTGALEWSSMEYSVDDIMDCIQKDALYYEYSNGGVTLSGGEPLFQFDFCLHLIKKIKTAGFHIALDTSGYVSEDLMEKIIPEIDLFLFDIKLFDEQLHKKITGCSNRRILNNFKQICDSKKDVIARIPMISNITDNKENIRLIKTYLDSFSHDNIEYIKFNKLLYSKWKMIGTDCPLS